MFRLVESYKKCIKKIAGQNYQCYHQHLRWGMTEFLKDAQQTINYYYNKYIYLSLSLLQLFKTFK